MKHNIKSIRPFLGAKNFEISCKFYKDLGFEQIEILHNLSYFKSEAFGFYLQKAYVKEWVDNTMVFMEVDDVEQFWSELVVLNLSTKYENVRLVPIKNEPWGKECFIHDPSGILWHIGQFN
jgi:hypothetical protein